jgi:hypothetical protein
MKTLVIEDHPSQLKLAHRTLPQELSAVVAGAAKGKERR